jgi:class 3 adenylate cyclase
MGPRIQYAKTADGVSIAYWTVGEGPPLVMMPPRPYIGSLSAWLVPQTRHYFELIAADRTIIRFDFRGFADSDRTAKDCSLDSQTLDLEGVVDSLGLRRFALLGMNQSGPAAIAFAARHPERVSHLVLLEASARGEDFFSTALERALGQVATVDWRLYTEMEAFMFLGWSAGEEGKRYAAALRESASPEAAGASRDATARFDVTDLLADVASPTLVVHHRSSWQVGIEAARRLAAGILDARLVVLEGGTVVDAPDETAKTVLAFLAEDKTASAQAKNPLAPSVVTILFTDLTSSTALTQRLGDAKAHDLVRAHNAVVREALIAWGGTEIKHTGDGIMASFSTASAALECAAAIQQAVAAKRDDQLAVHIGLNAGEPVTEEGDLFGTAVQLARRICDQAQGGEILVSDVVRQLAAGKGFLFHERGEAVLRGFEDPVRLYEVRWRDGSTE